MNARPQPAINPGVVTCAVMPAIFMEVLDTIVVNVSIPHIAGNLQNLHRSFAAENAAQDDKTRIRRDVECAPILALHGKRTAVCFLPYHFAQETHDLNPGAVVEYCHSISRRPGAAYILRALRPRSCR